MKPKKHENMKERNHEDIAFINDSAGTNPSTAAAAIRSFNEPLFLICGGKDKGVSFEPLIEAVRGASNLREVFLIGENAAKIYQSLQKANGSTTPTANGKWQMAQFEDLKSAVTAAYHAAKKIRNSIILFSPASASFDMFRDYKDRGEQFRKIVKALS